jgi:hypothetical protein
MVPGFLGHIYLFSVPGPNEPSSVLASPIQYPVTQTRRSRRDHHLPRTSDTSGI